MALQDKIEVTLLKLYYYTYTKRRNYYYDGVAPAGKTCQDN